ncbi:MAG TPA: YsnF/AvaK domain-containing protein [Chitinophagaceae bacterium]|jgi:stress response protein YsnF|nr:YsnF/AvaK domain-containing protein [Chitinophagaceae bacterium]
MAQTVVGFFDNPSEAQKAVQQLESIGIPRQSVDISSGTGTSNVSGSRSTSNDRHEENGITRFFKSLFGDKDDADRYSKVGQGANCIVTVHTQTEDQAEKAADILDDCGAIDVDERATQYGYERTSYSNDTDRNRTGHEETTIPRIQENLEVGKREVERGGVRVRSRIVERPVEENIRLREEHVHVERESVDRPVSGDELSNFQERDIELTERAEVPVVNKEARVVEEIRVSKDVDQREETIRDTVRNTDIDIDNLDKNRDSTDTDGLRTRNSSL